MAIIVEDGSLVSGANSYISIAEFKTWAEARGVDYESDYTVAQQILRAMDYIETLNFKGLKHTETQSLQWPRDMVLIDGYSVDADEIPAQLKAAVYEAVKLEIEGDSKFAPTERETVSEQVDGISVTYKSNTGMRRSTPAMAAALRKLTESINMVGRA